MIDLDDTVREVHGYAKQAAAYGYSGVRGLNVQLATISTPIAAPVIGAARLRRGNTVSATGCGRLLAQTVRTARAGGATGRLLVRADSAYYGWALVGTALRHDAWFSVTARMTAAVTAAISSIPESAWTPIIYPQAMFDAEQQRWISDAEVAEVPFTAFTGRRKHEHVTCRLVVRRVRRLQPPGSDGSSQGELFTLHRHHAFITHSTLSTVEADERHRDHAIIEQVIPARLRLTTRPGARARTPVEDRSRSGSRPCPRPATQHQKEHPDSTTARRWIRVQWSRDRQAPLVSRTCSWVHGNRRAAAACSRAAPASSRPADSRLRNRSRI